MSQQEENENLSLLGNKETNYIFEYQPEVLESFDNRHVEMTISSNLTVLNLPHFAQSLLSQTLQLSIFPTSLISSVLSQNPSNSTSLATETTEISTKTVSTPLGKTWSTC